MASMEERISSNEYYFTDDEPVRPFIKPKFIARKTGFCYSISSILAQAIGTVLIFGATILCHLLNASKETSDRIFDILTFSPQFVLAACVIFYMCKHKVTPVDMGMRKIKPLDFIMAIVFGLGVLIVVMPIENIFSWLLSLTGYSLDLNESIPIDENSLVPNLLLIALMPAVFEEFLMRGVVLNGTKECGTVFCVLMNGLLFSLLHANPSQTCFTFLLGCTFALIAIRCNSIIPTMILHFINNAASVVLLYLNITEIPNRIFLILLGVAVLFTVVGLVYFLAINKKGNMRKIVHARAFTMGALAGIIFNAVIWLSIYAMYNQYLLKPFLVALSQ